MADPYDQVKRVETPYKTSYPTGEQIVIEPFNNVVILLPDLSSVTRKFSSGTLTATDPSGAVTIITDEPDDNSNFSYTFRISGTYVIRYKGTIQVLNSQSIIPVYEDFNIAFYVSAIDNKYPLKKLTVTDVIRRLLDLAEPLRRGEKPRFRFQGVMADGTYAAGSQAEKFDKILAPEFTFTKQTLRECLRQVGGFIHGEPRLTAKKDEAGEYYYEVSFDLYAQQEKSGIWYKPYVSLGAQRSIENYAGHLDTNAENLVNQLDKFSGVIVEPYIGGAKSVRSVQSYTRIDETTMEIITQYPIYSVEDIEYIYPYLNLATGAFELRSVSIKQWLFEASLYRTQLSSYTSAYPYSKAYGIYFTQGEKNIKGLNFKEDAAAFAAFKNYAILNIIRQALSNNDYKVDNYAALTFRVTYTPFYDVRVAQSKSYIDSSMRPSALIYNQQANVVESRALGENLKGVIARIGNIELSITKILPWFSEIPRAGQIYKDDYYISAVSVAVYANSIRVTMGLSKDFNRLSQYIGISSVKRYYEVSQTQAADRDVLYREFMLLTHSAAASDENCLTQTAMFKMIAKTFGEPWGLIPLMQVTVASARGESYKGSPTNGVSLPVIASAVGNSISFSWRYEDNYSAGPFAEERFTQNDVQGYWQNDTPYGDYYGRIYYYHFALICNPGTPASSQVYTELSLKLPNYYLQPSATPYISVPVMSTAALPYILRKDNRERLQINVQLEFVTDIKGLIIGSALASYNPAVRTVLLNIAPRLYVFDKPLNKFTTDVEALEDVDLNVVPSVAIKAEVSENGGLPYMELTIDNESGAFPASGKAWAIVTPLSMESTQVEDEYGNVTTQEVRNGGDLLIAQNADFNVGDKFTPIRFVAKRKVFNDAVWKDKI